MRAALVTLVLLAAAPAAAQETPATADNPLASLKADLVRVLATAELPFEPEQDRALTLMMEDRLQASEQLFGGLMDFRGGPTSGQEAERLQSAIGWLQGEFLTRVNDYLTPDRIEQSAPPAIMRLAVAPVCQLQFIGIGGRVPCRPGL